MADAYTVFWAGHRCAGARTPIAAGEPLTLLFGGPHQSLPSFARAKVAAGDLIYPIAVHARTVFVLGRMRVAEVRTFTGDTVGRLHQEHVDPYPHWRFLADSCMTEVVIGAEGTTLRLDAAMPVDVLRRLTYRSQRGSRTVKRLDADGHLVRSHGLQGVYRLDPACAGDLDAVLAQPAGLVECGPRSGRAEANAQVKAGADDVFWRTFSGPAAPGR
ncbi:hypothetical protein [Actinoplanes palleronii]|uniref:Uncharacterized protein n=1 Tax=Actinoplanes palleronii TaxID=113570 RepID=A0ABQ4BHU5_9ACTN|nr:hypothetical protein [Actinoplanes palleronii]GIE70250.1 hypothetical protein Apa02nite_063580 [Actinoplanes palleronii]